MACLVSVTHRPLIRAAATAGRRKANSHQGLRFARAPYWVYFYVGQCLVLAAILSKRARVVSALVPELFRPQTRNVRCCPALKYKAGVEARSDNDYGPTSLGAGPTGGRPSRSTMAIGTQNGYHSGPSDGVESIGRSALHHPFLVVVVAVIGLLVGTAIGYKHAATYTADAQLIVGRASDLAQDQIPGLAVAEQELASDYARLATSTDVIGRHRGQASH